MTEALLYKDTFSACLSERFHVRLDDGLQAEFELVEVKDLSSIGTCRLNQNNLEESFSLLFVNPSPTVFCQGIYKLEHPRIGDSDIFLVPVGKSSKGTEYEAVFN